jgi:hypothetical protein
VNVVKGKHYLGVEKLEEFGVVQILSVNNLAQVRYHKRRDHLEVEVCFLGITCALVSTNYLNNFANVVLIV